MTVAIPGTRKDETFQINAQIVAVQMLGMLALAALATLLDIP